MTGNPSSENINTNSWKDDGPLELSPDRGRFALAYSIVEDNSFYFSTPIARFATPDLGYKNEKYVSLFAPGVSFIVIPGYIIGKNFGLAQVGTFAIISLFAIFNTLLIRAIAKRLGAGEIPAIIASIIFIFATPAFSYAVTLYQHHISTFLILSGIYALLRWNSLWSLSAIWFLCAASIPVDYPNLFLMVPIGIAALGKILVVNAKDGFFNLKVKYLGALTFLTVIIPLAFFIWFNQNSYGNPFQFSGTISSVKAIDDQGNPTAPEAPGTQPEEYFTDPEKQEKSAIRFFKSRNILKGFNTHFASQDRGIITYTPIILLGILGIPFAYKKYPQVTAILTGIIGINVLLYSMWGDAYGGWAFGSRYLIPSYALMSIFIALMLTKYRKNLLIIFLFLLLSIYSVSVNTLGAVTSNRNPPKVEAIPLGDVTGREEKYTYERNLDYLKANGSKSYIFQTFANRYFSAFEYFLIITSAISAVVITLAICLRLSKKGDQNA